MTDLDELRAAIKASPTISLLVAANLDDDLDAMLAELVGDWLEAKADPSKWRTGRDLLDLTDTERAAVEQVVNTMLSHIRAS